MWHTTTGTATTPAQFMWRRLERVAPLYWLVTLVMFAMPSVSRTISGGVVQDVQHLAASLLFMPSETPADAGRYIPIYTPGWTINFEIYFYALFAGCLFIRDESRRLIVLAAMLGAIVVAGQMVLPRTSFITWHTSPIIIEFVLGLVTARHYATGGRLPKEIASACIAVGLAALVFGNTSVDMTGLSRLIYWGLPAWLIVIGALHLDRFDPLPKRLGLGFLGDASYSLYLTHLFAIGAVAVCWHKLGLWTVPYGALAFSLFAVAASIGVAAVVYVYVERVLLQVARGGRWPAARPSKGARGAERGWLRLR